MKFLISAASHRGSEVCKWWEVLCRSKFEGYDKLFMCPKGTSTSCLKTLALKPFLLQTLTDEESRRIMVYTAPSKNMQAPT
jgi:hypothetical protein